MTHLQRLRELFDDLLDIPAEEWEDWFERRQLDTQTRSELRRLAAEEAATGPMDRSLQALVDAATGAKAPAISVGQRVGAFRLVRSLGEGGMSRVYLAEREGADFRQEVALKLLKRDLLGEVAQGFFRRERQVLARLSHPGIARLIDGGVSAEGVAYLAMEYVDGVSITRWCRDQALDADACVALVCKVARAAAAAHAALVVHRDIKPSNVIVTGAGEPVLLDFGIAKILQDEDGDHTRPGMAPMTPQYAAPEQLAGGAVTTATDVYALGLLLFELLTGQRADRDKSFAPSVALARGKGTTGTATGPRRIDRDLDRVVLKALDEDPEQRYPGAEALADDLERYLSRQPVRAHPPSTWYRTRKFVQRHRIGVALAAVLVLGFLGSLVFSIRQAELARAQADRAERVGEFLVELFQAAGQSLPREQRPTPASIVREARARLRADDSLDGTMRASLLVTLADVSGLAGEYAAALGLAEDATRALDAGAADDTRIRTRALLEQAQALHGLGRAGEAKVLLAPHHAAFLAGTDDLAVEGLGTLATLEVETGALEAGVQRAREAALTAERIHGPGTRQALVVQLGVGDALGRASKQRESVQVQEEVLARWRDLQLPLDRDYVNALLNLASARVALGDLDVAETETRVALELLRGIFDGPHDAVAGALQNLGGLLSIRGRSDEARPYLEESARMFETLFGPEHMQVASVHDALAALQMDGRDFAGASVTLERVTRICVDGRHEESDPACGRAWQNLSFAYLMQGRLDEAAAANQRSGELRRVLFGEASVQFAGTLSGLASIRMRQMRFEEACDLLRRALAIAGQAGEGEGPTASTMHATRARCLRETGRPVDALAALETAERLWAKNTAQDRDRELRLLLLRTDVLLDLRRRTEAGTAAARALKGGFVQTVLSEPEWQRIRSAAGQGDP